MSQTRIRSAFESRLASWAATQSLPVVWQNVAAELPVVDHLRAYLLPAETAARDLAGDNRSYRGIFQVSVFAAPGQGAERVEQIARALDELFPVALRMESGGLAVLVLTPMAARPAIQEPGWFSVPVSCRYAAEETKP
ncbi:MAG: DUF4128 domain-containing protein [Burkholderiaceae bacterium]|jgi:hypothetical protein|nr:DUF4128 domain-containing protein [Burkholderiaceae bacterium]